MGGHTEGVLKAFPHVRVVGLDRDTQALELAGRRLAPFGDRFTGVHAVYDEINDVLDRLGHRRASRACSWTSASRRCSSTSASAASPTRPDAPLDMRMDATTGQTAADVLNTYDERELARILRVYGEERFAPRIARGDRRAARDSGRWSAPASWSSIVRANIPAATRKTGGNPAKRTFQALRIEVNGEIEVLERALPAVDRGARRGRPDRRRGVPLARGPHRQAGARRRGDVAAPRRTCPSSPRRTRPFLRLVTRGAEEADEAELARNPRSQSVRLRAAERVRPTPDHLKPRQTGRRAA